MTGTVGEIKWKYGLKRKVSMDLLSAESFIGKDFY
jgi:hypothetical protein